MIQNDEQSHNYLTKTSVFLKLDLSLQEIQYYLISFLFVSEKLGLAWVQSALCVLLT